MHRLSRNIIGSSLAVAIVFVGAGQVAAQQLVGDAEIEQVTVALEGPTGSGQASLRANAESVDATVQVSEMPASSEWSAFLIEGTCAQPGSVVAALGDIDTSAEGAGSASASITSPLAELLAADATIQVHPRGDAPTEVALCAELSAANAASLAP